jgi:1-acyl-sn-glycerol-3-phosphate acyltransferase
VPRTLIAVPAIAALTAVFSVLGLLVALLDRSGRMPQRLICVWARLFLRCLGVRTGVSGLELLPAGSAVYAANHASALDIPIVLAVLPVDFRFIHKRSLYVLPVIGWYLFLAGHVGIDRANPFRARRSLQAAARRVAAGTSVVAFPEGTRSPDERVRPFKRGSFLLALEAGVPVVPVSLAGVKQVAPRGILTLRSGEVRVGVHAPIPTAGRDASEAEALAEQVRQTVLAALVA